MANVAQLVTREIAGPREFSPELLKKGVLGILHERFPYLDNVWENQIEALKFASLTSIKAGETLPDGSYIQQLSPCAERTSMWRAALVPLVSLQGETYHHILPKLYLQHAERTDRNKLIERVYSNEGCLGLGFLDIPRLKATYRVKEKNAEITGGERVTREIAARIAARYFISQEIEGQPALEPLFNRALNHDLTVFHSGNQPVGFSITNFDNHLQPGEKLQVYKYLQENVRKKPELTEVNKLIEILQRVGIHIGYRENPIHDALDPYQGNIIKERNGHLVLAFTDVDFLE